MMGIWIGDVLRRYDGTWYEVGGVLDRVAAREGGVTLYTACLLPMLGEHGTPDDWITVPVIVTGDLILCPYDWESHPDAYRLAIPGHQWVEMATGIRCVIIDGWPYLPPGRNGRNERPGPGDD